MPCAALHNTCGTNVRIYATIWGSYCQKGASTSTVTPCRLLRHRASERNPKPCEGVVVASEKIKIQYLYIRLRTGAKIRCFCGSAWGMCGDIPSAEQPATTGGCKQKNRWCVIISYTHLMCGLASPTKAPQQANSSRVHNQVCRRGIRQHNFAYDLLDTCSRASRNTPENTSPSACACDDAAAC